MAAPVPLYKYRIVDDKTKDIIVNHRLYFAAPANFNDPFDCKMPLDFNATNAEFEKWLTKAAAKSGLDPAILRRGKKGLATLFPKLRKKYVEEISVKSSLFCASERGDDILMFSHYSLCHTGCCLQFDFSRDLLMKKAEQVIYQANYPDLNYFRLHGDVLLMARRLILTKSSHWAYEMEWRVLRWRVPSGLQDIDASCLTGIIFGASISPADEKRLRDWGAKRSAPVKFYRAQVDSSAFKLNIIAA